MIMGIFLPERFLHEALGPGMSSDGQGPLTQSGGVPVLQKLNYIAGNVTCI